MKINSLKVWLLIAINILLISSLSFTAYVSFQGALHELDEIYDAQLVRNARFIGTLFTHNNFTPEQETIIIAVPSIFDDGMERTSAQERFPIGHKYESRIAFQVWQADRLLMASENAEQFPEIIKEQGFHLIKQHETSWISYSLPLPENIWVVTGQREDIRAEISEHLAVAESHPILFILLPLNIFIYLAIKFFLRPLTQLEKLVAQKTPEQLTEINIPQPKELEPIKIAINKLIRRVKYYLTEEKRFISDAAHELRTPLSILQLHAQNLLDNTASKEEAELQIKFILAGSQRMTHLVNQLLALNKLQNIQATHSKHINLLSLVQESLADLNLATLEQAQWQLNLDADLTLQGDEILLRSAFRNLFDNASKYSPKNGLITIQAYKNADNSVTISITNPITTCLETNHMTERFFRHSLHQNIDGSGLGLSIVQLILQLHKGTINIDSDNTTIKITITIPLTDV